MIRQGRFAHILKHNLTGGFPTQVVFFDTETQVVDHKRDEDVVELKLGWACYIDNRVKERNKVYTDWKYFERPVTLYEWLSTKCRKRRNLYLISANIWFDLRVSELLMILLADGWVCQNFFIKGMSQIFIFTRGSYKIVALNFQNFWPATVAQVGQTLGVAKHKVAFDQVDHQELSVYCKRDCEILYRAWVAWVDFCKSNDLGSFGKTLSSQAFNAFRHRFMPHQVYIHDFKSASVLERKAYFGGRTECYFIGKPPGDKFYKLDINSFYPWVMKTCQYPTKLCRYELGATLAQLGSLIKDKCVIAKVALHTERSLFPIRWEYKTIFPVGEFTTCLCTEGLRRALDQGSIREVHEVAWYDKAPIFKHYVDYFYKLKTEFDHQQNLVYTAMTKLFLNSLYGKFGQQNDRLLWEREVDPSLISRERYYDIDEDYAFVVICFGGKERGIRLGAEEGINSFVGISAHVTEYARLRLFDYIQVAGKANVFYCDTDSLIVNERGLQEMALLVNPDELGKFKIEDVTDHVIIHGLKDYEFGDKLTRKGIRITADQLSKDTFRQEFFPGCMGEIAGGLKPRYSIKYVTKKLHRKYDKGVVRPNGWVDPIKLKGVM